MAAKIRLAVDADAALIAELYGPLVESTPITFETRVPDAAAIRERIAGTMPVYPWLVCERDGRFAGYAYGSKHRDRPAYQWSVDTSVYVHPDMRRRGIGQALYRSLLAVLTEQGYYTAFAGIALPNTASVRLHESLGFQQLGVYRNVGFKLGEWRDVGWWRLPLRPYESPPEPAADLIVLQQRAGWDELLATGLATMPL